MPEIYLYLEGRQNGPYQIVQIRQLISEGKISAETPAWYQGLTEWSTVAKALAAFPAEEVPPVFIPPPPTPPLPPLPVKKGINGCLLAAIIVGVAGFIGIFVLSCLAGIALGPITKGIEKARESMAMQQARSIELAMFSYAKDHQGAYPEGKSSTEIFQKLLDEKYISNPGVFYISMPGKTRATSDTLAADNVCYDITSGAGPDSPNDLPLVFSTGYTVTYTAGSSATRDPGAQIPFPGMGIAYKDNRARFIPSGPDGTIPNFISHDFDPGTMTYQQLRP